MTLTEGWLEQQAREADMQAARYQGAADAFRFALAELRRKVDSLDKPPVENAETENGARPDQP